MYIYINIYIYIYIYIYLYIYIYTHNLFCVCTLQGSVKHCLHMRGFV